MKYNLDLDQDQLNEIQDSLKYRKDTLDMLATGAYRPYKTTSPAAKEDYIRKIRAIEDIENQLGLEKSRWCYG
jgi:hypothetical protein